jgi:hypothetical protein
VNGESKPDHFEGIALLPAFRATNVVNVTLMIGVSQNASAIVHDFEIEGEMLSSSKVADVIANVHNSIAAGVRSFTSERIESRMPIVLIKRIV